MWRRATCVLAVGVMLGSACSGNDDPSASADPDLTYAYDDAGRLATVSTPDGESVSYAYDAAGNRIASDHGEDSTSVETPVVDEITPRFARPGDRLTITGQHFASDPLGDVVVVGGTSYARVQSATEERLVVALPPTAASGPIQVATAGGTAQSDDALIVTSTAHSESDTDVATQSWSGPTPIDIAPPKTNAVVLFEGSRGHRIGLDVTGAECLDAEFELTGPTGPLTDPFGAWCGGGAGEAVVLPADGTYTLTVRPEESPAAFGVLLDDLGDYDPQGASRVTPARSPRRRTPMRPSAERSTDRSPIRWISPPESCR